MSKSHIAGQRPAQTAVTEKPTCETPYLETGRLSTGPSWMALLQIGQHLAQPTSNFVDLIRESSDCTAADLAAASPVKIPSCQISQIRMMLNLFREEHPAWSQRDPAWFLVEANSLQFVQPRLIAKVENRWEPDSWQEGSMHGPQYFVVGTPEDWLELKEGTDLTAALVNWLINEFGMELRAVVRSENELEAWFTPPPESAKRALAVLLPELGVADHDRFEIGDFLMLPVEDGTTTLIYLSK